MITLCYHDVRDDVIGHLDKDQAAVSSKDLAAQFSWLKEHGYNVVSMQDVVDAKAGVKKLPPKAVLLTFDDGYVSFYTRIYPLLKLYNYPAVFALVTKWLEEEGDVSYGGEGAKDRSNFLTWDQVKEMSESGLVEIASHSHDLHKGVVTNPQKNTQPAMVARIYSDENNEYEADDKYRERIYNDLKRSSDIINEHLNKRPRVMVWPYGAYSQLVESIAAEVGMTIGLTLTDHKKGRPVELVEIPRFLISSNPSISEFAGIMRVPFDDDNEIHRVAHIDIDSIYDNDPKQTIRNLDKTLDRIKAMGVDTVYLKAFADDNDDGSADALYFPNRHLPMRADLFNRIAWQLKTRVGVYVYAWLPVTAFNFKDAPSEWMVQEWQKENKQETSKNKRLSFFISQVRTIIGDVYEDMAKYANFGGLVFYGDAVLFEYEDVGKFAKLYAEEERLPPFDIIYKNPVLRKKWAEVKTEALIEFTKYLADRVRLYRPEIKTARNINAQQVLESELSEEQFAQSFEKFILNYSYTTITTMFSQEKEDKFQQEIESLLAKIRENPIALKKTIFELQTVSGSEEMSISSDVIEKQMRFLMRRGGVQFGYYPDNIANDQPSLEMLERTISLETFPFGS